MQKVVCDHAGEGVACKMCFHSEPHEKRTQQKTICTKPIECALNARWVAMVRCISVTNNQKEG